MYAHNSDSWSLAFRAVRDRKWWSVALDTGVDLGHWQFKLQRGNTNCGIRPADNRRSGRELRACPFENPGFWHILRQHDIGVQTGNPQVLGRLGAKVDF